MATSGSPYAAYRMGKPRVVPYDAGASTYKAGDVLVVGATPVVWHEADPAFTGATTVGSVAIGGGTYEIMSDGTGVIGNEAFWDAANKKITATASGNTHFGKFVCGTDGRMSGTGPASDGDMCWVEHDPRSVTPMGLEGNRSEATVSTTNAITAAQVLGGFINSAPAAGITLTTPTAALLVAGMKGCKVGDTVMLAIENTAGGANSITLAAGTGATLRGGATVAQNKSAILLFVLTNVTASSEAYTVYSIVGA